MNMEHEVKMYVNPDTMAQIIKAWKNGNDIDAMADLYLYATDHKHAKDLIKYICQGIERPPEKKSDKKDSGQRKAWQMYHP